MINETRRAHVHKSRYEAVHAAGRLAAILGRPVPVTGIIAVMGAAGGVTVKEQPRHGEVVVTTRRAMHRMLRRRPGRLEVSEVVGIFAVARLSSRWLPLTSTFVRECPQLTARASSTTYTRILLLGFDNS